MANQTEENLARSLTAETTDLLPFLPYLLQDLWELGTSPRDVVTLIKKYAPLSPNTKVLDIACGKGAISINIASHLGLTTHGIDIIPEFITYATQKSHQLNVSNLCSFQLGDANELIQTAKNYDIAIFGAAGNILGTPQETLAKLSATIKSGGHIIIDEAYLPDNFTNSQVKYKNYEYLTRSQWLNLFKSNNLTLLEELQNTEDYDFDSDTNAIAQRASELSEKHPEKRTMFESYVQSQLNECEDLENNITAITWILQKL